MTPQEVAASVAEAVAAGAVDVHVHPKDGMGSDSMAAEHVAAVVQAVRKAAPGLEVGVTTGAWTEPDPHRRAALVRSWTVLPDHASVNWHEDGAELAAAALLERGVGIEAGIFSGTDGAERFRVSPLGSRVLRVLAEVVDPSPATAEGTARELLANLGGRHGRPVLLHGEDGSAWPVLRLDIPGAWVSSGSEFGVV